MRTPAILLCTLLIGACTSPPPPAPFTPPALEFGVEHKLGTILGGPHATPEPKLPITPAQAWAVTWRLTYLERAPSEGLQAIGTRARLIAASRGAQPLLATSVLASGVGIAKGPAARALLERLERGELGRAMTIGEYHAALPVAVSTRLNARMLDEVETDELVRVRRRATILIGRESAAAEPVVAWEIEDHAAEPLGESGLTPRTLFQRQTVILDDAPGVDSDPLVLLFPSRFEALPGRAFLVAIDVRGPVPGDQTHDEAVARCNLELAGERIAAAARGTPISPQQAELLAIRAAIAELGLEPHRRATLVFLGGRTAAWLALDLALLADDAMLARWTKALQDAPDPQLPAGQEHVDFAWWLDRSALQTLTEDMETGELTGALRAMLLRHLGEAAHFPGTLAAALGQARDRAGFDAVIRAENLGSLDSMEPAARVRAFDWLAVRGVVPDGYDPLGERVARRQALARLAQETERQP